MLPYKSEDEGILCCTCVMGIVEALASPKALVGEGFNIASVLCPIPFHVNEIKYV